jgi:hypothetical protein
MSISVKSQQIDGSESAFDPESDLTEEERRQRQIELGKPLIALLQSWLEEDDESEEEQDAALEEFMRGIDEARPAGAKLFSP